MEEEPVTAGPADTRRAKNFKTKYLTWSIDKLMAHSLSKALSFSIQLLEEQVAVLAVFSSKSSVISTQKN